MLILDHSIAMQIMVSIVGVLLLCAVAYFKQWAATLDKAASRQQEGERSQKRGSSILNGLQAPSPL
jgi:hypothetical protein